MKLALLPLLDVFNFPKVKKSSDAVNLVKMTFNVNLLPSFIRGNKAAALRAKDNYVQ